PPRRPRPRPPRSPKLDVASPERTPVRGPTDVGQVAHSGTGKPGLRNLGSETAPEQPRAGHEPDRAGVARQDRDGRTADGGGRAALGWSRDRGPGAAVVVRKVGTGSGPDVVTAAAAAPEGLGLGA